MLRTRAHASGAAPGTSRTGGEQWSRDASHRGPRTVTEGALSYLTPEAQARVRIDEMLRAAGWAVQRYGAVNLSAGRGVAVREFVLAPGHGRADYLLFVDGSAVGALE